MLQTALRAFSYAGKEFEIEVPCADFLGKILNAGKLWEEYYRVIAPVIVLNKYDDNQLNKNNGTITTNNRKSQESRDTST